MYHGQVIFAPVFKHNEPVTKASISLPTKMKKKKQEMTMHFLFLERCGIVERILEKSNSAAMDIKDCPVPKGEERNSGLLSRVFSGPRVGVGIFTC